MGTINYRTSDYITLGLVPYDRDDYKNDADFMEWLMEDIAGSGMDADAAIDEYINMQYEDDYYNIDAELKKHTFCYFHVAIEWGYYEGFYLNIENNYGLAYNSWEDKREAQKEITEIKRFLIECAGLGLVQCFPGWGTKYSNYADTINAVSQAVEAMREEVRTTPTWAQYMRDCGQAS